MATRKHSSTRSRKENPYTECMSTQIGIQKKELLKKPINRKLSPQELQQKAFSESSQICKR